VTKRLFAIILAGVCLAAPATVWAQDTVGNPAERARFHFGPVRFTPVLQIRNVGVDTNVFNESTDPQQDFTATFGPATEYWVRFGKVRVRGKSGLDYNYFREFKTQRSLGTANELRVELPFNRMTPFVHGTYDNTRRRPDYEIDARTRTRTTGFGGGVDLRPLRRTTLRVEAEESRLRFDEDTFFFGSNLADVLNRRTRSYRISARQTLTPLTTFVLSASREQERFDVTRDRDANSYRVLPGFELDPRALIAGKAFVGFRSFTTIDEDMPDFDGVVALVEVVYTLRATRFGFRAERDAWYSYELLEPFYVVTDLMGETTQKVTMNWDLVGRVGHQTLDYQLRRSIPGQPRTDTIWIVGGGIGRHVGRSSRIGFDVDHVSRDSSRLPERSYDGWRVGGSLTYGVQGQ
jgi:hypothetical protein